MTELLASIPSPSGGSFDIGPLTIRGYGLMILLGIVSAVWLTGRRWTRQGGEWDLVIRMSLWGVGGGIVGARIYHVITSWSELPDEWWGPFAIWRGGLGIWGAIIGGVIGGGIVVYRDGASIPKMLDAAAPGVLLAQAIGRWGNWFNQELFGEPTTLPWGLEIDLSHRPSEVANFETFHPIFLYESVWNLIGVVLLLWVSSRFALKAPSIFALYVMWYSLARMTFEETLRIDPSNEILGLRLNHYVAIGTFLAGAYLLYWASQREESPTTRAREKKGRRAPPDDGPQMAVPRGNVRKRR
jgi:prolipoprotein diacylglyceryl transferase